MFFEKGVLLWLSELRTKVIFICIKQTVTNDSHQNQFSDRIQQTHFSNLIFENVYCQQTATQKKEKLFIDSQFTNL